MSFAVHSKFVKLSTIPFACDFATTATQQQNLHVLQSQVKLVVHANINILQGGLVRDRN